MGKITIKDIAKLAGVSKTTVSFYLNGMYEKMSEDTRKKIEKVIEKTDYQPSMIARSLNSKSNKIIGVIIGDVTNNFANHVIKGVESACNEKGYRALFVSSDYSLENEKQYVNLMTSMNVDGFIVQPTVDFENYYQSIGNDKPLVIFDSPIKESKNSWVKTDSYQAVNTVVEKMIEKGYEKFVYITANPDVLNTRKERYDGFMVSIAKNMVEHEVIIADENTSEKDLLKQIESMITDDKPVGVIVANNWLLDKVYVALQERIELIPQQVGLVGFDALEWSQLARPSVTTIVQPAFEEGKVAAEMLIELIENREIGQKQVLLDCKLNALESTNRK